MREEIGELIRKRRKELGISKEHLASLANLSPTTIYKIEHNKADPKLSTIEHLLNLLGYRLEIVEK